MKIKPFTLYFLVVTASSLFSITMPSSAADVSNTTTVTTASTDTEKNVTRSRIVSEFSTFTGSKDNATALVTGLRTAKSITLTGAGGATTTFTPPTKPMGFGNVDISLSLAKAELAALGISQPTPQQLQAALMGGSVSTSKGTTVLPGILTLRSEGKGWGVVAKSLGLKLGEVVSGTKSEKAEKITNAEREGKIERVEKPERLDRLNKPERAERVGR